VHQNTVVGGEVVRSINLRSFSGKISRSILFVFLSALAFGLVTLIADASARSRHSRSHQSSIDENDGPNKKPKSEGPPAGPLLMVVTLSKQHVSVYGNDGLVTRAPVSTGRPGHSTPRGIFSILEKERFHRSNLYSDAPMPFMQRITWSGVAMHSGVLPGYPASHGCIRMPGEFAKRLYGMTKGGEKVIISRQEIIPANFNHPRLPAPKFQQVSSPENIASGAAQVLQNAVEVATAGQHIPHDGVAKVDIAVKPGDSEPKLENAAEKRVNPIEFAKIMRVQAAAKANQAAAAIKDARAALSAKSQEVGVANVELRKANAALSNAMDRVDTLDRKIKKAKDDEAVQSATTAKAAAEAMVNEAQARIDAARQLKEERAAKAEEAQKAFREAQDNSKAAADAVKSWNRRLAPVSVFISRKTNRLYVRQGFTKVFDVPVTIRDPETPIGTHLFLAMQPEAENGVLHWLSLSVPEATVLDDEGERHNRRHKSRNDDNADRKPQAPSSAAAALDRIEIPADAADKISEMLWTGASLIVADNGMSGETGDYTDFIILTR